MDTDPGLDALVTPLRADVLNGSAQISRTAAEVFRRAAVRAKAGSPAELRWALGGVATAILAAQPAMASLVTLVRQVLAAADAAEDVEGGRHAAARAAEAFRVEIDARTADAATRAAAVLPESGPLVTISSSSTVEAALIASLPGRTDPVICLESRPLNEGRGLAERLARAGLQVTFAVDAAAESVVAGSAAVVFGADSIGDAGVVNKIGSAALAHAAVRAGVPVYVVADETKILPHGFPQYVEDSRPGGEVWESPSGIHVWNRYFEVVPMDAVTAVVTDTATLSSTGMEAFRADIVVPDRLRKWARRIASGPDNG
jgi:translation initiation factor eIF-2B subunit delta